MELQVPYSICTEVQKASDIWEDKIGYFDKYANLKYKYGNRHFWCRGYYVDTVGKNKKAIEEYIRNQLQEDIEYEQLTMKEYIDPFTGEPVKENK